jgi:hypothetical protein
VFQLDPGLRRDDERGRTADSISGVKTTRGKS